MLVVIKRRYKKQHVIGGAGIFDTITGVIKRLFSSGVANRVASTALSVGKDAAKELGKKALEVGKNTAVEAGKRLVDKAAAKLLADRKSTRLNSSHSQISYAVFCLKKKKKNK